MLNARRHRRGNQVDPEGNPAVYPGRVLNARRHRRGNQTQGGDDRPRPKVLNARRHRRGNQDCPRSVAELRPIVLNARRHRRGNQLRGIASEMLNRLVLNARRHRRGNQSPQSCEAPALPIRAQRPKASEGESGLFVTVVLAGATECSTPEGIGGGISVLCVCHLLAPRVLNARRHRRGNQRRRADRLSWHCFPVLNARRHRRGNQRVQLRGSEYRARCSTPEGIGGGIRSGATKSPRAAKCAQRPKASEGESGRSDPGRDSPHLVLNARRHRRGNQARTWRRTSGAAQRAQRPKASEGESERGHGSGWQHQTVLNARRHRRGNQILTARLCRSRSNRAQRPKASEGESGGSSAEPTRALGVLNARRHRRGNQGAVSV